HAEAHCALGPQIRHVEDPTRALEATQEVAGNPEKKWRTLGDEVVDARKSEAANHERREHEGKIVGEAARHSDTLGRIDVGPPNTAAVERLATQETTISRIDAPFGIVWHGGENVDLVPTLHKASRELRQPRLRRSQLGGVILRQDCELHLGVTRSAHER